MLQWDKVHLSYKIEFLKKLLVNSSIYTISAENIINALIAGSQNNHTGDMSFSMESHHIEYMRNLWDTAIINQNDNTVIDEILYTLNTKK
jgi:hypothetical protein